MGGEHAGGKGPDNVIPFEAFRRRRETRPPGRASISLAEDGDGDITYQIEGITGLNALAFLHLMLYLSERALKIYIG